MFTLKTTGVLLFLFIHGCGVSTGWGGGGKRKSIWAPSQTDGGGSCSGLEELPV